MPINNLKTEVINLVQRAGYFEKTEVLDETANTLKEKLVINRYCYVQIYANIEKKLRNYALILNNQRLYGIDCDGGKWHKHPWDEPSEHKFIEEVSLEEFIFEVYKELSEKNII